MEGGGGYIPSLFFICSNRDFIVGNWKSIPCLLTQLSFVFFGSSQNFIPMELETRSNSKPVWAFW